MIWRPLLSSYVSIVQVRVFMITLFRSIFYLKRYIDIVETKMIEASTSRRSQWSAVQLHSRRYSCERTNR